jgi:hypothetical protein
MGDQSGNAMEATFGTDFEGNPIHQDICASGGFGRIGGFLNGKTLFPGNYILGGGFDVDNDAEFDENNGEIDDLSGKKHYLSNYMHFRCK